MENYQPGARAASAGAGTQRLTGAGGEFGAGRSGIGGGAPGAAQPVIGAAALRNLATGPSPALVQLQAVQAAAAAAAAAARAPALASLQPPLGSQSAAGGTQGTPGASQA